MLKNGYKRTAECTLFKTAHEESGSSWNRELPKETIGHIQSAGCLGQKEVVAHNACIRELLREANVNVKADRHMKLLTIETESRLGTLWDQEQSTQFCSKDEREANVNVKADRHMKLLTIERESKLGTLWDQEQCTQFCSKDELWEAAKEEEMKIPWKEANEGSPVPEEQYQERFWRRRLDGIGLDTVSKEFLAIEFKRTRDAKSNYVQRATAVAQEQYTSLLTGGSVHVESFNKNIKALGVLESKWDPIKGREHVKVGHVCVKKERIAYAHKTMRLRLAYLLRCRGY